MLPNRRFSFLVALGLVWLLASLFFTVVHSERHFDKEIPADLQDIVIPITDATASQLDNGTWLVDVYAPWCGHCGHVFPVVLEVGRQILANPSTYPDVKIALIDGTTNPNLNSKYVASGYPTLLIKNTMSSTTQFSRTEQSMLQSLETMARPPVLTIKDRGQIKRSEGTVGNWQNLFTFLGPKTQTYNEFLDCAARYQGAAHFFSPFGFQDEQQIKFSHSSWISSQGNWDKQWDISGTDARDAHEDLMEFYDQQPEQLPVVVNQVAGRPNQFFHGPWDTGSEKAMCAWIEGLLTPPIETLATFNYQQIIEKSEQFLLLGIAEMSAKELQSVAIMPGIAYKNRGLFDAFTWTTSNLIPRLRSHYGITAERFVLVVNRELSRYWVTTDILTEEKVQDWLIKIRTDPEGYPGQPLYHWANILTPLVRDMSRWTSRAKPEHINMLIGLLVISLVVGIVVGLVIVCCVMESTEDKVERLKRERAAAEVSQNAANLASNNAPVPAKARANEGDEGIQRRNAKKN